VFSHFGLEPQLAASGCCGPPDPEFGQAIGAPALVRLAMRLLSAGIRRKARRRGVDYAFLLMKASGSELRELGRSRCSAARR